MPRNQGKELAITIDKVQTHTIHKHPKDNSLPPHMLPHRNLDNSLLAQSL